MKQSGFNHFQWAVVIAMVAMLVVQPTIDQIVDMIAVRHRFVAATRTVEMPVIMTRMVLDWMATAWIGCADFDHMLIDMIAMWVVQMAIVQVVNMVTVLYGSVTATGAVFMVMMFVMRQIAVAHERLPVFQ